MRILVVNGPNLNMLGKRNPRFYGKLTLKAINKLLLEKAKKLKVELVFFQSNHEGDLIDFLQKWAEKADGVLINPGALTHYSWSLRDACIDTNLPVIEVHLSKVEEREKFRKTDVLQGVAINKISGLKEKSYLLGLEALVEYLKKRNTEGKRKNDH